MLGRRVLMLIAVFQLINGLAMLVAPARWYEAVPGVVGTGPMNSHFIADIGLAFVASGGLLLAGASRGSPVLAIAGCLWPVLHALLHFESWLAHGLPTDALILASDGLAVMGPSFLAFGLALKALWRPAPS